MREIRTKVSKVGPVKGFPDVLEFEATELPYLAAREGLGRLGEILGRAPMVRDLTFSALGMMLIGRLHDPNVAWLTSQFESRTKIVLPVQNADGETNKITVPRFKCEETFPYAAQLLAWAEWFMIHVDLNFTDFLGEAAGMLGRQLATTLQGPPDGT